MTTTFAEQIHYERLSSGLDIALVPMKIHDVVKLHMQLGVGSHASTAHPALALVVSELLPGGGAGMKRRELREALERLGASMSVSVGPHAVEVSLVCRRAVVHDVYTLAFESLRRLEVTSRDLHEAIRRLTSTLTSQEEDTNVRALITLSHVFYKEKHPHHLPSLSALISALERVTLGEVKAYYRSLLGTVGGRVVVAGDMSTKTMVAILKDVTAVLPSAVPSAGGRRSVEALVARPIPESIIPIAHKMNVDTYYAMPLSITRDANEFLALALGVGILGASSTGRLFNTLRTRKSLTYGAYATLSGTEGGNPALLRTYSIFPNDLFLAGRTALIDTVDTWAGRGVTEREVAQHKEEVLGRYTIGLITTGGMARALLGALERGFGPDYLDEYPRRVSALTRREVNGAIDTFVRSAPRALVAAGAITNEGSVL